MANNKLQRFMPAELMAKQITADHQETEEKYKIITGWVSRNIAYDYVKAAKVAKVKGTAPDPVACWATHRGICQDIASLTVIMLRAAGVKSYLCIGHADNAYHAWVQAYFNGKVYRYDHENQAGKPIKYKLEKHY